jgi:hypothetical protein
MSNILSDLKTQIEIDDDITIYDDELVLALNVSIAKLRNCGLVGLTSIDKSTDSDDWLTAANIKIIDKYLIYDFMKIEAIESLDNGITGSPTTYQYLEQLKFNELKMLQSIYDLTDEIQEADS